MSSVGVVVPCYKYGHFLEDAVSSVLDDQPGVDVRVLIIDDASPDESGEVARKIAARDPRVDVILHGTNQGHIATYNEGLLEWCDADYSVLMSADDLLTPGALRRATDLLDAHPHVGFVYGRAVWFWEGKPIPAARTRVRGWSVWSGQWWLERRLRQTENCITAPEVVVRTSVQQRVGGYDPRLPHSGDQEMWMRLAADADVGFVRGVDQAYYRVHSVNMRSSYDPLGDMLQKRLAFDVALDRCRAKLADERGLADRVHRNLSRQALRIVVDAYDRGITSEIPVDELVAFARDCWPHADSFAIYRAIHLRRLVGAGTAARLRPVNVSPYARKVPGWLMRRSWKYRGF
jgi:glycosyltransferase involved in cell wall biosynthesis